MPIQAKNWNGEASPNEMFYTEKGSVRQTGWVGVFAGTAQWFANRRQAKNYDEGYRNGIRLPDNKMMKCGCCGVAMGVGMQCNCELKNDSYRKTVTLD